LRENWIVNSYWTVKKSDWVGDYIQSLLSPASSYNIYVLIFITVKVKIVNIYKHTIITLYTWSYHYQENVDMKSWFGERPSEKLNIQR